MNNHEHFREWAALAAAGALTPEEERQFEVHLSQCAECSEASAIYRGFAGGLRRLPTPQAPAGLVERTSDALANRWYSEAERRAEHRTLALVILFAWTVTLAGWPVVRLISQGVSSWLDPSFNSVWVALAGYTALAWVTGGVAAIVIAVRERQRRIA